MPATNVLAAGTTTRPDASARSSIVTLAAGASTNLVVIATGGVIPRDAIFDVIIATSNSTFTLVKRLTSNEFTTSISGPGDFYVDRIALGNIGNATPIALGVDKN